MLVRKMGAAGLGYAVCVAMFAAVAVQAANPPDQPGEVTTGAAPQPSILQSLLPPFTATPLERAPEAEGWGPLRISPAGRFCLSEVEEGEKRSVFLLDHNAQPLRDLTRKQYPQASAIWGYSDQHILLECRKDAMGKPLFLHMDRVTGSTTASTIPGVPRWSPTGKDYFLPSMASSGFYQRYTGKDVPVGHQLYGNEPVWSSDGQSLAYLAVNGKGETAPPAKEGIPKVKPEGAPAPSAPDGPPEIRILPARGDVPRVILSSTGWTKLLTEKGWSSMTVSDPLAWSPADDALYAFCSAKLVMGGGAESSYLLKLDLRSPKREVLPLPSGSRLVSTSGDSHHWILQMGDHLFRLDFAAPPAKKTRTAAAHPGGE